MTQAATETNPSDTATPETPAVASETAETPAETTPEVETDDKDPRVQRANREAARYRTELRTAQEQLEAVKADTEQTKGLLDTLRKALTGEGDATEADPAKVAQQLTTEVDTLRTENTSLRHQVAVLAAAPDLGANAQALLDSKSFTNDLGALDASAEDYQDQVAAAITKALESNHSLRASQGPGRGGAPGAGSAGDSTVTAEQFAAMDYKARAELFTSNPTLYRQLAG